MTPKIMRLYELTKPYYFLNKRIKMLGINQEYKGFYYLVGIMEEIVNKQRAVRSFSREIYPIIALNLNVNACTIERDIRHIINVLWEYKLKNKFKNVYKKSTRPSCQEFIYLVKNYITEDII